MLKNISWISSKLVDVFLSCFMELIFLFTPKNINLAFLNPKSRIRPSVYWFEHWYCLVAWEKKKGGKLIKLHGTFFRRWNVYEKEFLFVCRRKIVFEEFVPVETEKHVKLL